MLFATSAFGQSSPGLGRQALPNKPGAMGKPSFIDSTLKVYYVEKSSHHHGLPPAYYVDGRLVNETFIFSIDPRLIESIKVNKGSIQIDNVTYDGQMFIITNNPGKLKDISLTEIKKKYTTLKKEPAIFTFDGELLITSDYDTYMVDENLLWRILVDKVENKKDNIHLNVVKLLTKTEENMKPKIRIRGTGVALKE
jgi:hypothetical protein